jgi:hypothetical protein
MTYTVAHSDTLVVDVVYPVNFSQVFANITVVHRGTTGTIWLRTDGIEPVELGDDNYPVLVGQSVTFPNGILSQQPITRAISGTSVMLVTTDAAIPFTVYVS